MSVLCLRSVLHCICLSCIISLLHCVCLVLDISCIVSVCLVSVCLVFICHVFVSLVSVCLSCRVMVSGPACLSSVCLSVCHAELWSVSLSDRFIGSFPRTCSLKEHVWLLSLTFLGFVYIYIFHAVLCAISFFHLFNLMCFLHSEQSAHVLYGFVGLFQAHLF